MNIDWTGIKKCNQMGVLIRDRNVHTSLIFVDDQVVVAEDEDFNYTVKKLIEEFAAWG